MHQSFYFVERKLHTQGIANMHSSITRQLNPQRMFISLLRNKNLSYILNLNLSFIVIEGKYTVTYKFSSLRKWMQSSFIVLQSFHTVLLLWQVSLLKVLKTNFKAFGSVNNLNWKKHSYLDRQTTLGWVVFYFWLKNKPDPFVY